ncbi:MAG: (2Fe-2S)-binding protein [Alphaproteobacteria bacterium]|jgi:nicotinate dehydrogenase subunit A|nr:(2Fe-2S)-binding protein [Alphaproteobacteria bacterium]
MPTLNLQVNGRPHRVDAESDTPLLHVLRNQIGLTGAKLGCGLEQCGACAVLVDGESRLSCVAAASDFEGKDIVTVEGLAQDGALNKVQRAFIAETAAQCGYCTPGMVIAVTGLFQRGPSPSDADVQEALAGHLCRCGSHARILAAIDRLRREG